LDATPREKGSFGDDEGGQILAHAAQVGDDMIQCVTNLRSRYNDMAQNASGIAPRHGAGGMRGMVGG